MLLKRQNYGWYHENFEMKYDFMTYNYLIFLKGKASCCVKSSDRNGIWHEGRWVK